MAEIIRAATLSAVSRPLRRPGMRAAAPLAAATASTSAVNELAPVPPAMPVPAPEAGLLPAAQAALAAQLHEAPAAQAEAAAQLAQSAQLEQAAQLRQSQQALDAATARLAEDRRLLAQQQQQLQAERQQLRDEAGKAMADAERLGHAQGREQALRDAAAAAAEQVARLNAVVQALTQSRRKLLDDNEDMLVELAFAAVCRMLGASAASRAALTAMVGELVAAEREPDTLRVRLHPQDVAQLDGAAGVDPRLSLQADSGIELGGCIIDTPRGTLDARLELQLEHLRAALLLVRQQRALDEAPV